MTGHEKQKKYFEKIIKNKALSHAYLFSGPEMIGKKTFALELAETILGENFRQNPDFKFIAPKTAEGESKVYIEDIRDLKKFLSLRSYGDNKRIVIFDDAHFLTPEAANALLKVLEEPPAGSVLFLISSVPDLIPATILSRCEEVRFTEAGKKEIEEYLADKKLKKEDRDFLATLSAGKIGLIERLLKEGEMAEAKKAVDDLRKLFKAGIYEKMEYVKKLHEQTIKHSSGQREYARLVDYWLYWISAHVRNSSKNEKIVKDLLSLHRLISQPQFNHRLALENFLVNL